MQAKSGSKLDEKALAIVVGGAAGGMRVTAGASLGVGGGIALGALPTLFLALYALGGAYRQAAAERFVRGVLEVDDPSVTNEELAAKLEERARANPVVAEAFYRAWRALYDAMDDHVVGALVALSRDYTSNERRADWFYRAVCDLLVRLDPEEYAFLRGLFARCCDSMQSWAEVWRFDYGASGLRLITTDGRGASRGMAVEVAERSEVKMRALRALGGVDLARILQQEPDGTINTLSIDCQTGRRLSGYFL
jgi:hypothetical protein